jgi:hypothetical protein
MKDAFCGTISDTPTYPKITGHFPPIGYAGIDPATSVYYLAQYSFSGNIDNTTCKFYDSNDVLIGTYDAELYGYDYSILIRCVTPIRNTVGETITVSISWDGVTTASDSIALFTYTGLFSYFILQFLLLFTLLAFLRMKIIILLYLCIIYIIIIQKSSCTSPSPSSSKVIIIIIIRSN